MPAIAYGLGAYKRTAGHLPEIKCVNLYLEAVPEGESPVVLIPRPALVVNRVFPEGPVRGVFQQPGAFLGDVFTISGNTLYRNADALGGIVGGPRSTFAADDAQLLIATGPALYRSTGANLTTVSFPDNQAVQDVAYLNGYFLAAAVGTSKVYFSTIGDASAWDGLDFFSAERKADSILALHVVGDELWLVGDNTTEVWVPTGDADLPFARVEGRLYDRGTKARDTVCRSDNGLKWVGDDGIVYRSSAVPERISNHGIEERIAATEPEALRALAFVFQGHSFYVLTTSQGSFAFDDATGQWSEFSSYGRGNWRAHLGCMAGDVAFVGDDTEGKLYMLSDDVSTDNGATIQRLFSVNIPLSGQPVRCDSISIDASVGQSGVLVGQGSAPVVEMRFSRDAGNTWSNWRSASLGAQGSYRTRAAWLRCGIIDEPGRVMEFRTSDPVPMRLSSVRMNERGGGLSR